MAMQHHINGVSEEYEYMSSSIVMGSGIPIVGDNITGLDESAWPYEVDELDVPEMPYGDIGFGRMGDGVIVPGQYVADRHPRNRFKPRLQAKGMAALTNIPEINRRTCPSVDTTKRITEFKVEPGTTGAGTTTLPSETELPTRLQFPPSMTIPTNMNTVRRDSLCSNASSFYYR